MLKSNSHKKQEVHFMDITANNKHRFATKWMNTETVNYTAAYTLCLLVLFAVKQLCKVAFGLGAGAARQPPQHLHAGLSVQRRHRLKVKIIQSQLLQHAVCVIPQLFERRQVIPGQRLAITVAGERRLGSKAHSGQRQQK